MASLLIASKESAAGKTALCAGIGRKMLNLGKKAGYFSPIQLTDNNNTTSYKDASFIQEVLELEESPELLSPVFLSTRELWQNLTDSPEEFTQKIKKDYARISKSKDVVIIEGLGGLATDNVSTLACYNIAEALDTKVLILLRYCPTLAPPDIERVVEELGQRLLGIIINFVPESQIATAKQNIAAPFEEAGIRVWGILPEVRSLLGVSVKEMAEALGEDILTCPENSGDLVENIMLGAMTIDSGIEYFNRKKDKAAIIHSDRPDMQLAALQTPTKCLITTNNTKPLATVVSEAESKHIPIIVGSKSTTDTIATIEHLLTDSSFNSLKKLKKFEDTLDKYMDFNSLCKELGL